MTAVGVHRQEEVVQNQTTDVQQLLKVKEEELPHLCSSGLDQQNPELLHIKQEEETLLSRQGGQLRLKRDDYEKPQLFQVHHIKTEDNRETETPSSSSAEHMKTETDGEDCGGPEPGPGGSRAKWQSGDLRLLKVKQEEVPHLCSSGLDQQNPELLIIKKEEEELQCSAEGELLPVKSEDDANTHLQPSSDEKAPDSPGTEDSNDYDENIDDDDDDGWDKNMSDFRYENEDSDEDWKETRTPRPCVKSNMGDKATKEAISCPQCHKQFVYKRSLQKHLTSHSGESSSSLVEEKRSRKKQTGTRSHEKPFGCDKCGKRFSSKYTLKNHMTSHTGEKTFTCDDCGKIFRSHFLFQLHMKPYWKEIT